MKVVAYADNTTFTPTKENDILQILHHFEIFEKACGAKINLQKSAIMGLGQWRGKTNFPQGLQVKNELKITGILCSNNPHKYNTKQYNDILQHTDNTIKMYKHISNTIFGRSDLINTFILPKLLYISTVCEPPPNFILKIQKKRRSFIFKNTLPNIQHNTLIQTKSEGGIALQDLTSKIQALRLKYIGQVAKAPHLYPLTIYLYGLRLSRLIAFNNSTPHFFGTLSSPFFKSITRILPNNKHLIHGKTKIIYTALTTCKKPHLLPGKIKTSSLITTNRREQI